MPLSLKARRFLKLVNFLLNLTLVAPSNQCYLPLCSRGIYTSKAIVRKGEPRAGFGGTMLVKSLTF